MGGGEIAASPLLQLPAELIDKILYHLCPEELGRLARTCRLLSNHSLKDTFWEVFVQRNVPTKIPAPIKGTYRDLFLSHYPHWFLTRHRIWFSNLSINGKLVLARYDTISGCIEAFNIAAERGQQESGFINWDGRQVMYDTFSPRVKLDFTVAVIRLGPKMTQGKPYQFDYDVLMDLPMSPAALMYQTFLHTRALDDRVSGEPSTQLWPPRILPSPRGQRIRTESTNAFRSSDHVPSCPRKVSDSTFRIRQTPEFTHVQFDIIRFFGRSRGAEVCQSFGTLPLDAYTPTPEKPWQGIWCGDYNVHGCEFLAIIQPDDPLPLPRKAKKALRRWPDMATEDFRALLLGHHNFDGHDDDDDSEDEDNGEPLETTQARGLNQTENYDDVAWQSVAIKDTTTPTEKAPYRGRLEAIKLTGDPYVPRGEYSFIVPDLGNDGFIGHVQHDLFKDDLTKQTEDTMMGSTGPGEDTAELNGSTTKSSSLPNRLIDGARMVKSVGHVAGPGFTNDNFVPSQAILVSENTIAQYWKSSRHVCFYRRVNIDALLQSK